MNLNKLRDKAYQCAVAHGWHDEDLSDEHFLCLIISELMEAVEADRKRKRSDIDNYNRYINGMTIETNTERPFMVAYDMFIKGSVEEELADVCIRIFDLAGLRNVDLSSVSLPISNSAEHIICRKALTFTEWCYDVTRVIVRYNKDNFPIGYLFIGILQEICCIAEIIGFDLLWYIKQKMRYNELRPYKHGNKNY